MTFTLEELERLAAAATSGPWHHDSYGQVFSGAVQRAYNAAEARLPDDAPDSAYDTLPDPHVCCVRRRSGECADPRAAADAEYIAAACTAVPELTGRIRELEAEVARLRVWESKTVHLYPTGPQS